MLTVPGSPGPGVQAGNHRFSSASSDHLRRTEVDTSVSRFPFCMLSMSTRPNTVHPDIREIVFDTRQVLFGFWKVIQPVFRLRYSDINSTSLQLFSAFDKDNVMMMMMGGSANNGMKGSANLNLKLLDGNVHVIIVKSPPKK